MPAGSRSRRPGTIPACGRHCLTDREAKALQINVARLIHHMENCERRINTMGKTLRNKQVEWKEGQLENKKSPHFEGVGSVWLLRFNEFPNHRDFQFCTTSFLYNHSLATP